MSEAPAVAVQPPAGEPAVGMAGEPDVTRKYAWGVFALAFALMMFNYADRQLLVSMFPHFKKEWGLSDAQLGGLVSILSVTVALGTVPVALVVDRWSRVKSIALMGCVWSLATVSAAVTRSYGQLFGTRAAVGLGEAGYAPAAGALLSRVFPQRVRATIFGAFLSAASLGSVLGVVVGGVVAARWGWRTAFVVVGVPGLLLALLFLRVRDYRTIALPQLLVILAAGFTTTAPFGVVGSVSVDVVDPALRATAVSVVALAQNLIGFAVGLLVVGAVSDAYGLKAALAVIPVFCAFAASFLWFASRHYDNDVHRVAISSAACRKGPT